MIRELSFKDCEGILKCYFNSENFKLVDYENQPNNNHLRIKLKVAFNGDLCTVCFFGKCLPKNFLTTKNFVMEMECILPKIYFYKTDIIVLEDLSLSGYAKSDLYDLKHINLVLQLLAKFHAASVFYEEGKCTKTGGFKNQKEESIVCNEEHYKKLVHCVPNLANKKDYLEDMFNQSREFRNVLCHGNACAQNIMFQYQNGLPTKCKFVNLNHQIYSSPVYDVLYFICDVTDLNMRQKYFHYSLKKYYEHFEIELKSKFGLKISDILPASDFKLLIKYLLPEVKLRIALNALQNINTDERRLREILLEINEISELQKVSREDCYEIIENKLGHNDYSFIKYDVIPIDEICGFLGEYFKLKIEVFCSGKIETLNFFLKCMPAAKAQRDIVKSTGCFQKEVVFYESLVRKMEQVGIDCFKPCVVPIYLTRYEDLIVFENMNCLDYKSLPSQKPFDYNLLSMVVKKLAVFHGSCILLEEKLKININEVFGGAVIEKLIIKDDKNAGVKVIEVGIQAIPQIIDLLYHTKNESEKNRFKKSIEKVSEIFYEAVKPSKKYRNVICESDLWSSNILVKLVDDQPTDCRFIDFQHARYCPPSHDLLSVFYLTTDRPTRQKYMSILIDEYYEKLKETLEKYSVDIQSIYSKESFMECCNYMKPQVVLQMCLWFQFITCTSDEIKEANRDEETANCMYYVDRSDHIRNMCKKSSVFKQRLLEAILELKDVCDNLGD